MNDPYATAQAISAELGWIREVSERFTAVVGPEAAGDLFRLVEELQRRSPSAGKLPDAGQRLWRRLESALTEYHDLWKWLTGSEAKRKSLTGAGEQQLFDARHRFFDSLETFHLWIDDYYNPGRPEGTAVGPTSGTPKRTNRTDGPKNDAIRLIAALVEHHKPDEEAAVKEPLTQEKLASLLNWTQSRVSRRMSKLITGGMIAYRKMCRRGLIPGFIGLQPDGSRKIEAIYVEEPDE